MAKALQALLQTWLSVAALFCVALGAHPAAAELVNENLLAGLPSGYKVGFHDKQGNLEMTEWVPAKETVNNWTEMVTVQIFFGLKMPPEEFMRSLEFALARRLSRRRRCAADRRQCRERLSVAVMDPRMPEKSGHRQAGTDLDQGGAGQR